LASYLEELIPQIPAARLLMSIGYEYLTPNQALRSLWVAGRMSARGSFARIIWTVRSTIALSCVRLKDFISHLFCFFFTIDRHTLLFLDASPLIAAAGSPAGGPGFLLSLCARGYLKAAVSQPVLLEAH
jgi:hypothetical protein